MKRPNTDSETERNRLAQKEVQRYVFRDRRCLRCGNKFTSTGPHHRMCFDCRRHHTENCLG